MKPIILLLLLISLCVPQSLRAQAQDLYSGSVPVPDQSQSAREDGFPGALLQVLGKLSGLRTLEAYPEAETAVRNARSLVLSFHYDQIEAPVEGDGGAAPGAGETGPQTHLVVRFAQPGVDELARMLGLPRWPPARAPLAVWILVDDGASRRVLPLEYEFVRRPMDRAAAQRGLRLEWPQAGDDGDYGVDVQLLWGGYTESLSSGGEPADVLIVAARREGPEWNSRMILEYAGEHRTWRSRDIDLEQALIEAVHAVVDEIAAVQAIAPSEQGNWVHSITVGGLNSGEDYARCLAYLESLSMVDEVTIDGADPRVVRMSLRLNASPHYFEESVAQGGVLEYREATGQYVLQP